MLLIALSTAYPWYRLNTALQSAAPYKITKRVRLNTAVTVHFCVIIIKIREYWSHLSELIYHI